VLGGLAYPQHMPRDTLTRDQIVRVAIDLLDAEGIEGLSMRRLGERLDSAATAVYWHVKSKDNLVVLSGDAVFGEVALPDVGEVGWRMAAAGMANDLYAIIARHLWLIPAMSTHLIYGPGKARYDDHALSVYEAAGFSGAEADWALSTVYFLVLGRSLGEAAWDASRRRQVRDGIDEGAQTPVSEIALQFPRLRARLAASGNIASVALPDQSFEFGLHAILDGLEARLAARRQASPKARVVVP
jgi:AcrR family transcriptional regulator